MPASVFDFKAIAARYQQVGNPWVPNTDNAEEPVALKLAKNAECDDLMRRGEFRVIMVNGRWYQ